MIIRVEFDYHSKIIKVPNGYVENIEKLQALFLEWVEDQPACIVKDPSKRLALSYDEEDFLRYLNEVTLKSTNEKAYFTQNINHAKINKVIKF